MHTASKYTRKVTIRFKPEEFDILRRKTKGSTSKQLSDYIRRTALGKPVVVTYRNESVDSVLPILLQLKNELNAVGNNFNQAVKRLHTLNDVAEMRTWLIVNEPVKQQLLAKVDEVKRSMNQLYEQWSQK
jgi:hypothetical protein